MIRKNWIDNAKDYRAWTERKKRRRKFIVRVVFYTLLIGGIVFLASKVFATGGSYNGITEDSKSSYVGSIPTPPALVSWIEDLGRHENCPAKGMVDSNGLLSYGRFCYQEKTFRGFVKKFNMLPNAEYREVMNFIGDNEFQLQLTERVFMDDPANWVHWKNTVEKKVGLPPNKRPL